MAIDRPSRRSRKISITCLLWTVAAASVLFRTASSRGRGACWLFSTGETAVHRDREKKSHSRVGDVLCRIRAPPRQPRSEPPSRPNHTEDTEQDGIGRRPNDIQQEEFRCHIPSGASSAPGGRPRCIPSRRSAAVQIGPREVITPSHTSDDARKKARPGAPAVEELRSKKGDVAVDHGGSRRRAIQETDAHGGVGPQARSH